MIITDSPQKKVKPLVAGSFFATFINLPTCCAGAVVVLGGPRRRALMGHRQLVAAPVQAGTIDGGGRRPVRGKRLGVGL